MEAFTISTIFEYLQDQQVLLNPKNGRFRFRRRERVEDVYPKRVCDMIAARSASYYSWFLNKDKQGIPIRDYLRRLFEEDSYEVIREMENKCRRLLDSPDGSPRIGAEEWRELLALAGREVPLFVRGSEGAERLERIAETMPERTLACLFLVAGMDGMTPAQYEQLLTCWRLMDRALASEKDVEPLRHVHAGELLYLDGNRREALNQLIKAAVKLRRELQDGSDADSPGRQADRELLGRVLLRIGEIFLQGGEDETDVIQAQEYLSQSVSAGCAEAYMPLAMLLWKMGQIREAGETFLQGAGAGVLSCLRILGNSCYRGDEISGNKKDLRQAAEYYLRGSCPEDTSRGDAVCQYMLGRILEEKPGIIPMEKAADPEYWYAAAARQGNEEAAARLNRLRWYAFGETGDFAINEEISQAPAIPGEENYKENYKEKYCLLNSDSQISLLFAESLPEKEYRILICTGNQKSGHSFSHGTLHGSGGRGSRYYNIEDHAVRIRTEIYPGTMAQAFDHIGISCLKKGKDRSVQYILDTFPEILCAAFDDNEERNIQDGLQVLHAAFLLHEKTGVFIDDGPGDRTDRTDGTDRTGDTLPEDREEKDELFYLLSERAKLYLRAEEKKAAPVFDSAFSRLGDFYLPFFLCDRAKMSSAWLLDRMPLFIPCLQEKDLKEDLTKPRQMNVMIFGNHPGITQLCKDILAAAQIEDRERFPFSLTVIGDKADLLEESLLADCPGIADPSEDSALDTPVFIKMDPCSRRFQSLLALNPGRERDLEEEELADRLQSASYLVVYPEDENDSLSLAMYLREWYLKTDASFTRLPFIAAYCGKRGRANQLRTLTAGAETAGFAWYNNYRIETFGREDQLFSYDALVRNRLEQRAMASHFAYYTFTTREDRFRAEHDYFSRNYNRDSSLMNALALPYRLFSAGIAFQDWHDYAAGISQESLAARFEDWLEAEDIDPAEDGSGAEDMADGRPENSRTGKGQDKVIPQADIAEDTAIEKERRLEKLAIYEHGRWNRSMFSRGWLPATIGQMLAYIQRGNGRHQLYIARLHPFLYSWEKLGEAGPAPTGIQKEYSAVMRQVRPDREPSDIRGIDRENVKRTAGLIRSAP